jgi:hypothetical protein
VKFELTTELAASPELVWEHVQTSRLLTHVAAPLVVFEPLQPSAFPGQWADGEYEVRMRLWGWLPVGRQTIGISRGASGDTRVLIDAGRGQLAKTWHHVIRVEPGPAGNTRYTDALEIRAGIFTPVVWLFAQVFYRHRQRRWRALVRGGFNYRG